MLATQAGPSAQTLTPMIERLNITHKRPDQLTKHQRLVVVLTLATSRGRVDPARSIRSPAKPNYCSILDERIIADERHQPTVTARNGRGRESGLRLQNRPADDAFAVAAAIVQFERRLHCGISRDHAQ